MPTEEEIRLAKDRKFRLKHKHQNIKFRSRVGVIKNDGRRFEVIAKGFWVPKVQAHG